MLGLPDLEVEKISSSTYGWKRILVAVNGEMSEPRQLKLPPQATFASLLERSSALHGLGKPCIACMLHGLLFRSTGVVMLMFYKTYDNGSRGECRFQGTYAGSLLGRSCGFRGASKTGIL